MHTVLEGILPGSQHNALSQLLSCRPVHQQLYADLLPLRHLVQQLRKLLDDLHPMLHELAPLPFRQPVPLLVPQRLLLEQHHPRLRSLQNLHLQLSRQVHIDLPQHVRIQCKQPHLHPLLRNRLHFQPFPVVGACDEARQIAAVHHSAAGRDQRYKRELDEDEQLLQRAGGLWR